VGLHVGPKMASSALFFLSHTCFAEKDEPGKGDRQMQNNHLPRNIFSFWEGTQDEIVEHCMSTWRGWAPNWQINMLNTTTADKLLGPGVLPPTLLDEKLNRLSDLIRLEVLSAYGGVWIDATIALTAPLEAEPWVRHANETGTLSGFETDFHGVQERNVGPRDPDWHKLIHSNGTLIRRPWETTDPSAVYFESWAFAASKDCPLLHLWRDEFKKALAMDGGCETYCQVMLDQPNSSTWIHPSLGLWLPYLTIHVTLARARNLKPELRMFAVRAEMTALRHHDYTIDWKMIRLQDPSSLSADGTGRAILAMGRGLTEFPPPPDMGTVVKFRNIDRTAYACLIAYGAYAADSPFARIFNQKPLPRLWPVKTARYVAVFEARFGNTDNRGLILLFWVLRRVFALLLFASKNILILSLAAMGLVWLCSNPFRPKID